MFAITRVNPLWLYYGRGPSRLDISSQKIEDAAEMFTALLEENERLKAAGGEPRAPYGQAASLPGLASAARKASWELAAILREGERVKIRKVADATGPLSLFDESERAGTLDEKDLRRGPHD